MANVDGQVLLDVLMRRTEADELTWERRSDYLYPDCPGWELNYDGFTITLSKWPSLCHRYWSLRIWGNGVNGVQVAKRGQLKELVALLSEEWPHPRPLTKKEQLCKAIDTFRDK